jgi:hypothetical protein
MKHKNTFVCLDDITELFEEHNPVIYNPNIDKVAERVDRLYNSIERRFNVKLSSKELIELTKYSALELDNFIIRLREIITAHKK